MKYAAAIFDIDGTLVPRGQETPAPAVIAHIESLQKQGVKIIIATGRCLDSAKAKMGTLRPDYFVCVNGGQTANAKGETLAAHRLSMQEMYALVDFCDDAELPLMFTYEDGYYVYAEYERYISHYKNAASLDFMFDESDRVRHLQSLPFGGGTVMSEEVRRRFGEKYSYLPLCIVPFAGDACDIYSAEADKALAVCDLLKTLGLSPTDAVAFGDNMNDAEMLRAIGHGVAMGNGNPQLQPYANAVAKDIADALNITFGAENASV